MRHIVMAAKGTNTPHDVAELTLMTLAEYRRKAPVGAIIPSHINYAGDAAEIANFLTEHLPQETLEILKSKLTIR